MIQYNLGAGATLNRDRVATRSARAIFFRDRIRRSPTSLGYPDRAGFRRRWLYRRPEHRRGFIAAEGLGQATARAPERRGCDHPARDQGAERSCAMSNSMRPCRRRCAGSASRTASRFGPAERPVASVTRHLQGARDSCSPCLPGRPDARRRAPDRSRGPADAQDRPRCAEAASTLGLSTQTDVNDHAVDRLGRPLRQRLQRSRPSEARLCAGRRAVPRVPRQSRAMVCARIDRRDDAVLGFLQHFVEQGPTLARALLRHFLLRTVRVRPHRGKALGKR